MDDRGATPGPTGVATTRRRPAALARIVRHKLLAHLDRRRTVFRWRDGAATLPGPTIVPQRIAALAQVPESVFRDRDPGGMPREWYAHFFAQGAALWTAIEHGRALGSLWVVPAERLGAWYVPVEREALIVYGVVTPARERGRRVAGQLALAAARDGDAAGRPVYLDCMVWNRPAHHAFEKAGFEPMAVVGTRWRAARMDRDV